MAVRDGGLFGRWFWYDEAEPPLREVFHGQFVSNLGDGYWLVRFSPSPRLRPGTQEVVHIQTVSTESWTICDNEDQRRKAMAHGVS